MSHPQKRGWCPTLHTPMQSGDGLLVRVNPPGAQLTPAQARTLAHAAERHGNGTLQLTQRGNIQVRGLAPDSTAPFADAMVGAGLAFPPAREARRPVMPPALLGADPALAPEAASLTARLERAFATDPRLAGLPAKFAVHMDAGGILGGRPAAATLVATVVGARVTVRPGTRADAPPLAGPIRYPGTDDATFALTPPFGQLNAAMLRNLAVLADRWATTIRVTPWRTVLLARVPAGARIAEGAGPAWITDPRDPRLRVTACIGAPGCRSATTPTGADATQIATYLQADHPSPAIIHVSGCSKGCAHPGPAAVTLVGRDGRYDLVRNGRANDAPDLTGLTPGPDMASRLMPGPGGTAGAP